MRRFGTSPARWLVFVALFAAAMSFGQGKKLASDHEEKDNPRERELWFRRGRPSDGGMAAEKLHRAYRQKLANRAALRARLARANAERSAAAGAAVSALQTAGTSSSAGAAQIPASGAVWTPLGPAPENSDSSGTGYQDYGPVTGRATSVVIDPNDSTGNTVYLGGAYGGLWKSTNAADPTRTSCGTDGTAWCAPNVTWTPLIDSQATLAVGAIAVQPGNSNVILVGTGESNSSADSYYGLGILRSTQGGAPGSWTLITSANSGAYPFRGLAFSRIAFSTYNPSLVVASAASASGGIAVGGEIGTQSGTTCSTGASCRGLYYSTDGGANWFHANPVQDGSGVSAVIGSAHSVVYNATQHKFFAAIRYHGLYWSSDGANWTRMTNQPAGITLANCPSNPYSSSCPLYRAEIAVVPGRDEMYVWVVDNNDNNQGVFQSRNGGTAGNWVALPLSGMTNCGSGASCGTEQGTYNLALAAVPNGAGTDIYAGAVNEFKCTIADPTNPSTCSFVNLTHVYGCSPPGSYGHVHPDEHSIDFVQPNPSVPPIIYFANDGGIYRVLNSYAPASGACGTTPFPFDNLNGAMGSMTQYVWFSQHPTDSATLLGGTQDNGSPATGSAGTSQIWTAVNNGDGGFNDIDPTAPVIWYSSNTYVSIQRCTNGSHCTYATFNNVITQAKVGNDYGSFYTPYMLDPQNPARTIVGTCRVWRGNSDGTSWTTNNALSYSNFSGGSTTACPKDDGTVTVDNITALAAGGRKNPTTNTSKVLYAGTENGRIYITTNAGDSGLATWQDVTSSINPKGYLISSIALDPTDATAMTAYVTIMGFDVSHVFKTTNGGTGWTDYTGDLPNAPADAVVVDPGDPNTIYVGNDVGVFATTNGGVNWTEVGLDASGNSTFPNTAITRLMIFSGGSTEHLRVSTYGRGVWDIDLGISTSPGFALSVANPAVSVTAGTQAVFNGTLSSIYGFSGNVTVGCTGAPAACTVANPVVVPQNGSASFTVTLASVPAGDFNFTIQATNGSLTQTQAVTLHGMDFTLGAASPASVNVPRGTTSSQIAFQLTSVGSFQGTVTLLCSGLPTGATCNISNGGAVTLSANGTSSVSLTVSTQGTTLANTCPVTVTATPAAGGPPAKTQQFSLVVQLNPDFALPSNPPDLGTVKATATLNSSFNISVQDSYSGTVNLSCTTSAGTCQVPASVSVSGSSTPVSISVTPALAFWGSGSVTVTATDGSKTHQASFPFTGANFDFIQMSYGFLVVPGSSGTWNAHFSLYGNYSGSVNLTCNVVGIPGATCTTSQTPVTVSSTTMSTLTASVPQATPLGTYTATFTATDTSLSTLAHTATTNTLTVFDYALSASPIGSTTISAGGTASYTVTPSKLTVAVVPVSLSCSNLPLYSSCLFSPSSVNTGTPTTLSISTTRATSERTSVPLGLWLPIGGVVVLGVGVRRRKLMLLALLLALVIVALLQGCGGGGGGGTHNPGTPAGTYQVTVSGNVSDGSASGITRSTQVTLTVQ
jgi:hypothetical protein